MNSPTPRLAAAAWLVAAALLIFLQAPLKAADTETYTAMAPLDQYLMPRDAEIALARSAGPKSITDESEVLVLTSHGYETAIPGHNGYVCVVERGWEASSEDAEFWNPSTRGPICWNPAGARYCVPLLHKRTALVLAGKSRDEIGAAMKAALQAGEFPTLEEGAMCFMTSKDGRLNNADGHWHPHLMFYLPVERSSDWAANLPGSPVFGGVNDMDHVTIFMVPVRRWSDGSMDAPHEGH